MTDVAREIMVNAIDRYFSGTITLLNLLECIIVTGRAEMKGGGFSPADLIPYQHLHKL